MQPVCSNAFIFIPTWTCSILGQTLFNACKGLKDIKKTLEYSNLKKKITHLKNIENLLHYLGQIHIF